MSRAVVTGDRQRRFLGTLAVVLLAVAALGVHPSVVHAQPHAQAHTDADALAQQQTELQAQAHTCTQVEEQPQAHTKALGPAQVPVGDEAVKQAAERAANYAHVPEQTGEMRKRLAEQGHEMNAAAESAESHLAGLGQEAGHSHGLPHAAEEASAKLHAAVQPSVQAQLEVAKQALAQLDVEKLEGEQARLRLRQGGEQQQQQQQQEEVHAAGIATEEVRAVGEAAEHTPAQLRGAGQAEGPAPAEVPPVRQPLEQPQASGQARKHAPSHAREESPAPAEAEALAQPLHQPLHLVDAQAGTLERADQSADTPATGVSVVSPQALFRVAYFRLDPRLMVERQRAVGVGEHRLPYTLTCSSLEGPTCLEPSSSASYPSKEGSTSDVVGWAAGLSAKGGPKVKLTLLKQNPGEALLQLVSDKDKATSAADADTSSASELSGDAAIAGADAAEQVGVLGGGAAEVLFEGDPTRLPDVEGILESVASIMGIPTESGAAAGLRTQLVRTLAEAERAQSQGARNGAEADAGEEPAPPLAPPEGGPASGSSRKTGGVSGSGKQERAPVGREHLGGGVYLEPPLLLDAPQPDTPPPSAGASGDMGRTGKPTVGPPRPPTEVGGRGEPSMTTAAQGPGQRELPLRSAGRAAGSANDRERSQEKAGPLESHQSANWGPGASAERGSSSELPPHPDDAGKEVYTDDSGHTFVLDDPLPGGEGHPEEQGVFYDDYGERFVVDATTRRVRREDVLITPLPESLQWLNKLSDDEYNAYWDEVDAREAAEIAKEDGDDGNQRKNDDDFFEGAAGLW